MKNLDPNTQLTLAVSTREAFLTPLDVHKRDIATYRTDVRGNAVFHPQAKVELPNLVLGILFVRQLRVRTVVRHIADMLFQHLGNRIGQTHHPVFSESHGTSRTDPP